MKIGVWINKDVSPNVGGGFSYATKLVELIDQREFHNRLDVCFVSFEPLSFPHTKESIVITRSSEDGTYLQKLFLSIIDKFYRFRNVSKRIRTKENDRLNRSLHQQLKTNEVDVLYYLGQIELHVPNFPFIATNWDLGHLTLPPFPEVSNPQELEMRKKWYNHTIKNSIAIFAESEAGKSEIIQHLKISKEKVEVLPMFPGNLTELQVSNSDQLNVLKEYGLEDQNFFFYPAQFWEHKNHKSLIIAFAAFLKKHPDVYLVFSGSDKGCLDGILEEAKSLGINNRINYLGFISNEALFTLYKKAIALVMPTFLGPTNMPPLEARDLDCPVLCSDFEGHREQLGEGAIYFDQNDTSSIEKALIEIMDTERREDLLERASFEKSISKFNSNESIKILDNLFLDLSV